MTVYIVLLSADCRPSDSVRHTYSISEIRTSATAVTISLFCIIFLKHHKSIHTTLVIHRYRQRQQPGWEDNSLAETVASGMVRARGPCIKRKYLAKQYRKQIKHHACCCRWGIVVQHAWSHGQPLFDHE